MAGDRIKRVSPEYPLYLMCRQVATTNLTGIRDEWRRIATAPFTVSHLSDFTPLVLSRVRPEPCRSPFASQGRRS